MRREGTKASAGRCFGEVRGWWDPLESHPLAVAGVRSPHGGRRLSAVGARRVRAHGQARGWSEPACGLGREARREAH
jgi:hypothetical protein